MAQTVWITLGASLVEVFIATVTYSTVGVMRPLTPGPPSPAGGEELWRKRAIGGWRSAAGSFLWGGRVGGLSCHVFGGRVVAWAGVDRVFLWRAR